MSKHVNIPIFIPHEGCPNDCVFCNQRKISGHGHAPSPGEMNDIIAEHLETLHSDDFCEIAFFGGSFTGLSIDLQEKYLSLAARFVDAGKVNAIRLSTRPDYINDEILSLLNRYHVKTVELGIQSLDTDVLRASKRFYSPEEALKACKLVKQHGLSLGAQTMIGLPGDTFEKSRFTAKRIIEAKPDMVRIYPTLVIRETELEAALKHGNYHPLSLDEAVAWCSEIVPMYEQAGIKVLRIGLQETEDLKQGLEVLAGPVHPAFGELVYQQIWLRRICSELDKLKGSMGSRLIIHVAPSEVSMVIGQHRKNIEVLKNTYRFTSIKVSGDRAVLKSPKLAFHD